MLVPSSFRHIRIKNPISKLTNLTVTWPLTGSEARGDLDLIETAQFFFRREGWGAEGSFSYIKPMLTSKYLKKKADIFVSKQGHLRLHLQSKANEVIELSTVHKQCT